MVQGHSERNERFRWTRPEIVCVCASLEHVMCRAENSVLDAVSISSCRDYYVILPMKGVPLCHIFHMLHSTHTHTPLHQVWTRVVGSVLDVPDVFIGIRLRRAQDRRVQDRRRCRRWPRRASMIGCSLSLGGRSQAFQIPPEQFFKKVYILRQGITDWVGLGGSRWIGRMITRSQSTNMSLPGF